MRRLSNDESRKANDIKVIIERLSQLKNKGIIVWPSSITTLIHQLCTELGGEMIVEESYSISTDSGVEVTVAYDDDHGVFYFVKKDDQYNAAQLL